MKIIKELVPYVIIFVVIIFIRTFIVTPVMVDGDSMETTLKNNQMLLLKKYDKSYERFDIVVFDYDNSKLVKRIVGLPGETVKYKSGKLYINDVEIDDKFANITKDFELDNIEYTVIPENYYFVLGDNRNNSLDSRYIGLIHKDKINGITSFSLWPFKQIG